MPSPSVKTSLLGQRNLKTNGLLQERLETDVDDLDLHFNTRRSTNILQWLLIKDTFSTLSPRSFGCLLGATTFSIMTLDAECCGSDRSFAA